MSSPDAGDAGHAVNGEPESEPAVRRAWWLASRRHRPAWQALTAAGVATFTGRPVAHFRAAAFASLEAGGEGAIEGGEASAEDVEDGAGRRVRNSLREIEPGYGPVEGQGMLPALPPSGLPPVGSVEELERLTGLGAGALEE